MSIINTYTPSIYLNIDLTKVIGKRTVIIVDFNNPISRVNTSEQRVNNEMRNLNNTVDQIDHTDVYSTFHPTVSHYTFFQIPHEIFSGIYCLLDHNTRLNNCKKI